VNTTPTLLLVDETGNVKEAWPGQLDAGKEAQVVKRLTSSL
jgi:thioredoxin-related protein